MQSLRKIVVFLLLCKSIASIVGSKCPEARKPHVTSCTIFYNCINLPEGGYVWAPAKCADGLVFQPYLRMCVLPGDTWTCDDLSIESSTIKDSDGTPELIDPTQTSYHDYAQVSSPLTDRLSASLSNEGTSELANLRVSATPYPLIEIPEAIRESDKNDKKMKNFEATQAIVGHQGVKNYWYQYFNRYERIPPRNEIIDGEDKNLTRLKGFINKILLYENVGLSLDRRFFVALRSTTCEPPAKDLRQETKDYAAVASSDILNYLVRNYVRGTRRAMLGSKAKKTKKTSSATTAKTTEAFSSITESSNSTKPAINSIVDELKAENNVVAVQGNLGGKEYVTVAKYKSLSTRLNVAVIEILECAKGVRLPNRTDCAKYYTCDPETASVVEFSCSPKTAFDVYKRVCETHRYKTCARERSTIGNVSTTARPTIETTRATNSISTTVENPAKSNPCQSIGKFADSSSEKHYYICYALVGNEESMNSIRMMCPNNLIFCQEKRVCTSRRRCYN